MRHGRPPGVVGPQRVPDRILGNMKVSRARSGETVQLPGGQEAELIYEVTQPVCPAPQSCEADCIPTYQPPLHLAPTWGGEFVHHQQLLHTFGAEGEFPPSPTATMTPFFVPKGRTLFVEKLIFLPLDSDYATLQLIPLQDGAPVLAPYSTTYVLLPTFPLGQRNVRWEVESNHTFGLRVTSLAPSANRHVWVGFVGWLEAMKCNQVRYRS